MKLISIPNILRVVEIVLNLILIGVYYGTDTFFKDDADSAASNFGQFVLIGGLISACIMLALCVFLELDKKMPIVVIAYNAVWAVFYFAACVTILKYWHKNSLLINEDKKKGGLTVGSFCLFEVVVLVLNSVFTFVGKTD